MGLSKVANAASEYIVKLLELLLNSAVSNLQVEISKIRSQNYDENGDIDIEKSLKMINKFYLNDFEQYCSQNGLNMIRELEIRKDELEQDMFYIINIIICVFTSILSTVIINYYIFWYEIIRKSWGSFIYTLIEMVIAIVAMIFMILFFPTMKLVIHHFRKEKKAEIQILNQYELKVINELLGKKIEKILGKR